MPEFDSPIPKRVVTRRTMLGWTGLAGIAAMTAACAPEPPSSAPSAPSAPAPTAESASGWTIVWEDDFSSERLDQSVWTAADYGGNRDLGELQDNVPEMVALEGGNLVLHARREESRGYTYVAGSVSTKGKRTVGPYGRLTTRQLLGPGTGIGFGVCLYGENIDEVGWPACGEIDATEIALARPTAPFASVHGPGYSGGSPISTIGEVPSLVNRWAEHVLEWEPGRLTWAIDGEIYAIAEAADARAAAGWPFDQPFFVTIVLTIGSALSGPVDENTWPRDASGTPIDAYASVDFIRFEQRAS